MLETSLHSWHETNGGRMVDFAGWSMPVQYTSIIEEHHATRRAAALFDVSHMGRFEFFGNNALAFLDHLTTRRVANTAEGKIRYSLMCNEQGTILDDVLVYGTALVDAEATCSMVVNASNRDKLAGWIQQHLESAAGEGVTMVDRTLETAMIAVQGPHANSLVTSVYGFNPDELGYYSGVTTEIGGVNAFVSRTGYTGEDGCEIIVAAEAAPQIWEALLKHGGESGVCAAGLGARDTLRLEAAMPLYGHELSESINAAQTGLGFAINMKDREFVGKAAISEAKTTGGLLCRIGLELEGRRAAREHSAVFFGGNEVGEITSGTFSPTLERPIAMAYVSADSSEVGTEVEVDIRGKRHAAKVVKLPFYQKS